MHNKLEKKNFCDCMVLNLWPAVNYGAMLTCFGLQCLLEDMGLNVRIINYIFDIKQNKNYSKSFAKPFADKYLKLTKPIKTHDDFCALNDICSTFIVGSDQVWRRRIMNSHHSGTTSTTYLLDFVKSGNKKLSYAGSFGSGLTDVTDEEKELFKYFLSQFDDISVREEDAANIIDSFGLDNTLLIDGAFLIPHKVLDEMTKDYQSDEKYVAFFTLPYFKKSGIQKEIAQKIADEKGLPLKEMIFDSKISMEQWLSYLKNAQFVVSDSYHATVMSIIFNVPFVQVVNAKLTQSRFETLFNLLGLENNSIDIENSEEIDFSKLFAPIDWDKVNKKIEKEVGRSRDWLEKAFKKDVKPVNKTIDAINKIIAEREILKGKYAKDVKLCANSGYIFRKYYKYKLLSKLTFGKKRKYYKSRRDAFKKHVRFIRANLWK